MDHQAGADSGILQERAQRLRDVSQGMSVRRAFPLLVEIAVPDDLLAMLRRVTALYILASLRCAQPARVFDLDLLNVHGEDILRLPNRTPNGKLIAKREIALEFNLVQDCVELIFRRLNLEAHIDLIQLPVNVRIQDGKPDVHVDSRPYATSKIHSDIWIGEAADSVTLFIPVLGDITNTGLEFFEPQIEKLEDFVRTFDDYRDAEGIIKSMHRYDAVMSPASIYAFDSFCLHQTIKRNGGIRVSIEFRFIYKRKLASDLHPPPERLTHYVPQESWYTLEHQWFLQPTEAFAEAAKKYGGALTRGGASS